MNNVFITEIKDMLIAELAQYLPKAHSFEDTQIILDKIDEIAKGYESEEIVKAIPLSAINKKIGSLEAELNNHSFWQDAGGEPLVAICDVVEVIDRKVKEIEHDNVRNNFDSN